MNLAVRAGRSGTQAAAGNGLAAVVFSPGSMTLPVRAPARGRCLQRVSPPAVTGTRACALAGLSIVRSETPSP
jgi:hypothetical protein